MNSGQVVERGAHNQFADENGLYASPFASLEDWEQATILDQARGFNMTVAKVKRNFAGTIILFVLCFPLFFYYRENPEAEFIFAACAFICWGLLFLRVVAPIIITWTYQRLPGFLDGLPVEDENFKRLFLIQDWVKNQ